MAPNTHAANETKCADYGRFLQTTSHLESNIVYWACFVVVIFVLIVSAILYASSRERQLNFELASHTSFWHTTKAPSNPTLSTLQRKHRTAQRRSFWGSLLCAILMIPIIVVEALAGLSISFCHQEDLIMFYWGLFFLLQIGSLIATWGLFLSQSIENEPAWNVALGTPVLVFAALGHWVHVGVRWGWKWVWGRHEEKGEVRERVPPKFLPYCHFCQEGTYLSMSSYPSQDSEHPLMIQRTQRPSVGSNVVEPTRSRTLRVVGPTAEITSESSPRS